MILAKVFLGLTGTVAVAGAYTFHDGVIRVDVDEYTGDQSHVHFWVPATAVPAALHLVPQSKLQQAFRQADEWAPIVHALATELKNYPEADLVEVIDKDEHVQVRMRNGRIQVDVDSPTEKVHVACPVETIDDVARIAATSQFETPRAEGSQL